MLVLTRLANEGIEIGNGIIVRVLDVREGGRVRLGIEAPREIRVDREEVAAAKRRDERRRPA